ncbi:ras association domain-containing protein 6-like [Geothlypis trichas]
MKKVTTKAQHLPSVFINEEKFVTRGMTRWGEFDDLHHISGDTLKSTEEQPDLEQSYPCYESHTLRSSREQELDCATLPRTSSDAAAVCRRTKLPTITRTEVETHRFSINGHFYNHETSVFTPAFGSETKIRIDSQMRSRQVIEQLLRKFKVSLLAGGSVAVFWKRSFPCALPPALRERCGIVG